MRRLIYGAGLAIVTFVAGVYAFSAWLLYYPALIEHPPCQSCASVYSASPSGVPTVAPCALVQTFPQFERMIVRVRARVKHDAGYFGMAYGECSTEKDYVQVAFDPSMKSCSGVQRVFDDQLGHEHWCWKHPFGFDGSAEATMVGRLEYADADNYGHSDAKFYRFVVLCVEQVSSTEPVH